MEKHNLTPPYGILCVICSRLSSKLRIENFIYPFPQHRRQLLTGGWWMCSARCWRSLWWRGRGPPPRSSRPTSRTHFPRSHSQPDTRPLIADFSEFMPHGIMLLWIKYELHIATEALLTAELHSLFFSAWHLLQNFLFLQQHSLGRNINFSSSSKTILNLLGGTKSLNNK